MRRWPRIRRLNCCVQQFGTWGPPVESCYRNLEHKYCLAARKECARLSCLDLCIDCLHDLRGVLGREYEFAEGAGFQFYDDPGAGNDIVNTAPDTVDLGDSNAEATVIDGGSLIQIAGFNL